MWGYTTVFEIILDDYPNIKRIFSNEMKYLRKYFNYGSHPTLYEMINVII